MKKMLSALMIGVLLLFTVSTGGGALVWYESNMEEDEFIIKSPLEGENCEYGLTLPDNVTVSIINKANNPVNGTLSVTLTGGHKCQFGKWSWWCLVAFVEYKDEVKPFFKLFSPSIPAVTRTFSSNEYVPNTTNIEVMNIKGFHQVVDVCWKVSVHE